MSDRPQLTVDLMDGFMRQLLMPNLATPRASPKFHRECWEMVLSDYPRVAIAAPRGHAKSTAVTFACSLASALFRRDKYTVIVSRTYTLATEFIRTIKDTLLTNEKIQKAFGFSHLVMDTADDFIVQLNDGYQFRFQALGFGGSVRGLNWGTQRPTAIYIDDAEDDEMVMSPDRRDKALNWTLASLQPMKDPVVGRIRAVGTFMHIDSMLRNLTLSKKWRSKVYEAHNDDFSQILWPEMYTKAKLLDIRGDYDELGKLDLYNMEYRNRVIDASTAYFHKDEFLPIQDRHKTLEFKSTLSWWAGGDFAWSVQSRRDYTVLPVVATDHDNNMYVYFIHRARMDAADTVDEIFNIQEAFNPGIWFNERGAISNSLQAAVDMKQREKGVFINIQEMPVINDKRTRARTLQARMRAKTVYWDTDADWFPEVQQELLEFDRGAHDDCVDALAHIAIGLAGEATPLSPDEEEELEYEQHRRETYKRQGGRDRMTGY
jgi:predicted phage terminase large subunit-like protein